MKLPYCYLLSARCVVSFQNIYSKFFRFLARKTGNMRTETEIVNPYSANSISNSNVTNLANDDRVLSSVKLWTDGFLMQKKKLFKYVLNKIDPTIEPCGTPEIMPLKSLLTLLIRTHCLWFMVFQVCKNIFQGIPVKSISREFCN